MKHRKRESWEDNLEIWDLKRKRDDRAVEITAWLLFSLMVAAGGWAIWMIATH